MNGLNIRPMHESDLAEIVQIEKETYSDPWSRRMFLEHLNSPSSLDLVLEKEGVIGFACTTVITGYMLAIDNFTIRKEERKKGWGASFLSRLIDAGRELKVTNFTLEVRESNLPAIGLYEKFSFKVCGRRKGYYYSPVEDALIMTREE
jgi:ribosomal-protein-alanine N-acetyltransferase